MATTFVKKSWTDSIINRLARTVTHTPVTKTTDPITGAETLSNGQAANISAAFLKRSKRWMFDKDGLVEGGDAYLMVKTDVATPTKDDLIAADGTTYRVQDVITRYSDDANATSLFHYCNLFVNA